MVDKNLVGNQYFEPKCISRLFPPFIQGIDNNTKDAKTIPILKLDLLVTSSPRRVASGRDAHAFIGLVTLSRSNMSLTILRLLILLDQITATATTCSGEVDEAATLKIVLLAQVGALESEGNPMETNTGGSPKHKALYTCVSTNRCDG
jgi:hypothetical protein